MKNIRKMTMAALVAFSAVIACGCTKSDDSNNGGNNNGGNGGNSSGGTYNGHAYVDLGLPSGTLWATCNVGANAPEEYGDYFAWGETQPKDYYSWSTYKYCKGDEYQLTKYCSDSYYGYNGFTDYLYVLQPMDDAATANWGSGWCMPNKEQWDELRRNTINQWTTQNGINGWLFTARNGHSLFLPAADCYDEDVPCDAGEYGNYWSSLLDLSSDYSDDPWIFYFYSGHYHIYSLSWRYEGLSVRAVRSTPQY